MKEQANEIFEKYVANYDFDNSKIKWKYIHSYRVAKIMEYLSSKIGLSSHNQELAYVLGLYHDIGRFYQIAKYNAYKYNIDHGNLGAKIIQDENILNNLLTESDLQTVKIGIKYHNKYQIAKKYQNDSLVKLIRDADKLDILRAISEKQFANKDYQKTPAHKERLKEFYNNKLYSYQKDDNISDEMLVYFSYIFDINYPETLKTIYDEDILTKIYHNLHLGNEFLKILDYANNYLSNKIIFKNYL